jgi:hypothetical protein
LARKESLEPELEEDLSGESEAAGSVEVAASDRDVTPVLTGLEPAEKEKNASAMTSTAHEDKI